MLCILLDCNMLEYFEPNKNTLVVFETDVFHRIEAQTFMDSCNEEYI